ncbi:hypothetical protein HGRIS_005964 [Hohenbuehelia grisea]|uniref:Amino acid transporter transmembrane domain-containing protein n=1 Tax=Hohenbuehelia grisea TaxID=104357 RepID=A0ABR3JZB5_9AGAR
MPHSPTTSDRSSDDFNAMDSSTALILVHDDDGDNSPFELSDDEEHDDTTFETRRPSVQPLAPSVVFIYLLSPFLKHGAMLLPDFGLPLKYAIPPLLLFAVLSAFVRQIWYMLARYLRKVDIEDIVLDMVARGRGYERRRQFGRSIIRASTGGLRILLAIVYMRESVFAILPLVPDVLSIPSKFLMTVIFAVLLLPISTAQSLASKRIIYCTWISVCLYLIWFICVAVAHAHGTLRVSPHWQNMGTLWQGITATAFAFTSSSTLPLYASLRGTTPVATPGKAPRNRSFRTVSTASVLLATCLLFPLVFFSATPNVPPFAELQGSPGSGLQSAIDALHAFVLLSGIPPLIVTTPPLPIPERIRYATTMPLSRVITSAIVILVSLVPRHISNAISDVTMAVALFSTYLLPAILHIVIHNFKRPLSIIIPTTQPPTPSPSARHEALGEPSTPLPTHDELLQRKERAMQKRQFRRRLVWDIGVWVLLLPVGGGGVAWAIGRIAGLW